GQRKPRLAMCYLCGRKRRQRNQDRHCGKLPKLATPSPVHHAARLRHAGPTKRGTVLRNTHVQDHRQPGASGQSYKGQSNGAGAFVAPNVVTVASSNIQLNGIPYKLVVCVRKVVANLTCNQTDSYATIPSRAYLSTSTINPGV
ncbi:MAG: hypothetical protein ACKPKO_03655, partial [Candidatus Fonsibacter sp.]